MRSVSLIAGGSGGWGGRPHLRRLRNERRDVRRSASSEAGASGKPSYFEKVAGWQAPLKAGLISGALSGVGDVLAQTLTSQAAAREGKPGAPYDPPRTLRMAGYGFTWYGPLQFYWYNLLDWVLPVKTTATFLGKVAANQLILAPITLSSVFTYNLTLTGKSADLPRKLREELLPTMQDGWKFWIPAASINFYCIPLKHQVLYMSACGVLWTAYLSYTSNRPPPAPAPVPEEPAATAPKTCCAGKCKKSAK